VFPKALNLRLELSDMSLAGRLRRDDHGPGDDLHHHALGEAVTVRIARLDADRLIADSVDGQVEVEPVSVFGEIGVGWEPIEQRLAVAVHIEPWRADLIRHQPGDVQSAGAQGYFLGRLDPQHGHGLVVGDHRSAPLALLSCLALKVGLGLVALHLKLPFPLPILSIPELSQAGGLTGAVLSYLRFGRLVEFTGPGGHRTGDPKRNQDHREDQVARSLVEGRPHRNAFVDGISFPPAE
jgi:hypothetical protein